MSTRLRVRCQRERHRSLMVTCCLVRLARKNREPPRPRIARKPSGENLLTKSEPDGADRAYRFARSNWGNHALAIRHSRVGSPGLVRSIPRENPNGGAMAVGLNFPPPRPRFAFSAPTALAIVSRRITQPCPLALHLSRVRESTRVACFKTIRLSAGRGLVAAAKRRREQ
jgi:hypothetical protein